MAKGRDQTEFSGATSETGLNQNYQVPSLSQIDWVSFGGYQSRRKVLISVEWLGSPPHQKTPAQQLCHSHQCEFARPKWQTPRVPRETCTLFLTLANGPFEQTLPDLRFT